MKSLHAKYCIGLGAPSAGAPFLWSNMPSGPVAQWIEQLRPKEKVVRSTRSWATSYVLDGTFFVKVTLMVKYRYGNHI